MTGPLSQENRLKRVREAAYRLLAVRARSASELRRQLYRRAYKSEIIDEVIADFQAKGYLNDEEFARQLTREKWSSSGWGPGRIRRELRAKGINLELTEQAVEEVFANIDLVEALMPLALKRWHLTEELPAKKRRLRLSTFLQTRGYDWEVINQVLRKLGSTTDI